MGATFSELLTSVKPRARTERFHVLVALYCLGAHEKPATVGEIRALLDVHIRGKAPSNLSACLRKHPSEVEVGDVGPPLGWRLTDKGIAFLRTATKLDLRGSESPAGFTSDVGIVCALEHPEFSAVRAATGGAGMWKDIIAPNFPHRYQETTIATTQGTRLRVVGTTSMSMGLTSAAIVTTQLVLTYRPRIVMMVGIAAGTKDGRKQFGDILVADPSVDYNSGKVVDNEGVREFLPDPYPIGLNTRLRSLLQKYLNAPSVFDELRARWGRPAPNIRNRLHLGPLGAADQVIDDASRVEEIQKNWRKLIGVEMETYAVYRSCNDAPHPKPRFVSFKAVCDFAANKADSWQEYAAFMAAEFGIRFLQEEWDLMWPVAFREGGPDAGSD